MILNVWHTVSYGSARTWRLCHFPFLKEHFFFRLPASFHHPWGWRNFVSGENTFCMCSRLVDSWGGLFVKSIISSDIAPCNHLIRGQVRLPRQMLGYCSLLMKITFLGQKNNCILWNWFLFRFCKKSDFLHSFRKEGNVFTLISRSSWTSLSA